ncbi:hypothetical protein MSPP1_001409 [Malassezia sp. CBS 17886]|nr:hypothetical protein MSPP1_001409 [Malassezia sp. CBS 17886]
MEEPSAARRDTAAEQQQYADATHFFLQRRYTQCLVVLQAALASLFGHQERDLARCSQLAALRFTAVLTVYANPAARSRCIDELAAPHLPTPIEDALRTDAHEVLVLLERPAASLFATLWYEALYLFGNVAAALPITPPTTSLNPTSETLLLVLAVPAGVLRTAILAAVRTDEIALRGPAYARDEQSARAHPCSARHACEWYFAAALTPEGKAALSVGTTYPEILQLYAVEVLGQHLHDWEYAQEFIRYSALPDEEKLCLFHSLEHAQRKAEAQRARDHETAALARRQYASDRARQQASADQGAGDYARTDADYEVRNRRAETDACKSTDASTTVDRTDGAQRSSIPPPSGTTLKRTPSIHGRKDAYPSHPPPPPPSSDAIKDSPMAPNESSTGAATPAHVHDFLTRRPLEEPPSARGEHATDISPRSVTDYVLRTVLTRDKLIALAALLCAIAAFRVARQRIRSTPLVGAALQRLWETVRMYVPNAYARLARFEDAVTLAAAAPVRRATVGEVPHMLQRRKKAFDQGVDWRTAVAFLAAILAVLLVMMIVAIMLQFINPPRIEANHANPYRRASRVRPSASAPRQRSTLPPSGMMNLGTSPSQVGLLDQVQPRPMVSKTSLPDMMQVRQSMNGNTYQPSDAAVFNIQPPRAARGQSPIYDYGRMAHGSIPARALPLPPVEAGTPSYSDESSGKSHNDFMAAQTTQDISPFESLDGVPLNHPRPPYRSSHGYIPLPEPPMFQDLSRVESIGAGDYRRHSRWAAARAGQGRMSTSERITALRSAKQDVSFSAEPQTNYCFSRELPVPSGAPVESSELYPVDAAHYPLREEPRYGARYADPGPGTRLTADYIEPTVLESLLQTQDDSKLLEWKSPNEARAKRIVSHAWHQLASEPSLWRILFFRNPGWDVRADVLSRVGYLLSASPTTAEQAEESRRVDWKQLYTGRHELDLRWFSLSNGGGTARTAPLGSGRSAYIISGSRDRTIRVWDSASAACLTVLSGHQGSVLCLAHHGDMLLSGSSDETARIWYRTSGPHYEAGPVLRGHTGGILHVAFDENWIVTASRDKTLRVWTRTGGTHIHTYVGHRGSVNACSLYRGTVASGSGEGGIMIWDAATGATRGSISGPRCGVASVILHDATVISGSSDKTVRVWDAGTGDCLHAFRAHTHLVRALAFDPQRLMLVSGGWDKKTRVWDLAPMVHDTIARGAEPVLMLELAMHHARIFDVCLDTTRVVSACEDHSVWVTDFGEQGLFTDVYA